MAQDNHSMQSDNLLNAFRAQYHHFSTAISNAIQSNVDSMVLARLGDDLDEYDNLVQEVRHVSFHRHSSAKCLSMEPSFFQLSFRC